MTKKSKKRWNKSQNWHNYLNILTKSRNWES